MEYNKENYDRELKALEKEFELRKERLIKLYAHENNPYKPGDIIATNVSTALRGCDQK